MYVTTDGENAQESGLDIPLFLNLHRQLRVRSKIKKYPDRVPFNSLKIKELGHFFGISKFLNRPAGISCRLTIDCSPVYCLLCSFLLSTGDTG
jgi:hypothetical protein